MSNKVTGIVTGDGECFCWKVTEEEYIRIKGEEKWKLEKSIRDDDIWENEPWYIYPDDLLPDDTDAKGEIMEYELTWKNI